MAGLRGLQHIVPAPTSQWRVIVVSQSADRTVVAMTFTLRLLPWLRRRLLAPATRCDRLRPPDARAAPTPADEDAALDADVMRRRVQHFCDEFPPPSRTRR